jgi:TonB family protein
MKKGCLCLLLLVLSSTLFAASDDKGLCPSPPSISKQVRALPAPTPNQPPPEADAKFAGTVFLLIVISNKGYVCSVQLIRGFDKEADRRAMEGARRWRFHPATKNGHPVAVEMRIQVGFWRKANGELISASPNKTEK